MQVFGQRLGLGLLLAAAACGDNAVPSPDAGQPPDPELLDALRALPGVTAEPAVTSTPGYSYFVLHFTQPVDHDDPGGPTFQQEVSLLHKDRTAPMIVETDGYDDYTLDSRVDLTQMLDANQISIEHRFFASSIPASPDWSKVTVAQMAADEHAIVTALGTIYSGARVSTGASKGGMTATYFRRFYPDDVAGTVAYVAPQSFGAPDFGEDPFFTDIGPADGACRDAIRAAATDMLQNRRAALVQLATRNLGAYTFSRFSIDDAVELSVAFAEWAFWQYQGVDRCVGVPDAAFTDAQAFGWLESVNPVEFLSDDELAEFTTYYFQAGYQLGYPDTPVPYLDGLLHSDVNALTHLLPDGAVPTYDGGTAMHDIDDFVKHDAEHMIFVYGQWDPYSAEPFDPGDDGDARDVHRFINPEGTHGSEILDLPDADRDAALAPLEAWTGVTPKVFDHHDRARRPVHREPPLIHVR